jgi:hypothetical protein
VATLGSIIDLSDAKAARKSLGRWVSADVVTERVHELGIAHAQREVLVAFRGRLPVSLFQVVDPDTGHGQRRLAEVGQIPCMHWMFEFMRLCGDCYMRFWLLLQLTAAVLRQFRCHMDGAQMSVFIFIAGGLSVLL